MNSSTTRADCADCGDADEVDGEGRYVTVLCERATQSTFSFEQGRNIADRIVADVLPKQQAEENAREAGLVKPYTDARLRDRRYYVRLVRRLADCSGHLSGRLLAAAADRKGPEVDVKFSYA